MADNSNNTKFQKLLPEDIEFFERVNSRVTSSHALPFELPVDAFFQIVVRSLKWFWQWYEYATQEQILFISRSAIAAVPNVSGNIDLVLPNGIEGIIDWKSANSMGMGSRIEHALKISLLQNSGTSSGGGGYGSSPVNISNAVIAMHEIQNYRELFTRGIRANFNKNTQIFRLMTNIPDGLVLHAMVRLHPSQLYGDFMFEDHVASCVEEQLGRIVMAFDFKLPGDVQINYDEIKSNGKDRRQEIEQEIKESNNMDMMQSNV